ncbi:MAG: DUF1045 domain-containing protein [Pseudomonadota bacterium]
MTSHTRYAVYFAPERGSPLALFGAAWLGWDADAGCEVAHPPIPPGVPKTPVAEITATPRKYGFHGTLKPPFRLADSTTRAGLETAIAALAARKPAFEIPALRLARLGWFLALVPGEASAALADLAFDCVRMLDRFRAPLSAAELARRRAAHLTPREEELLARWGYPYVDDAFRFHLTLSGALVPDRLAKAEAALAPLVAPLCAAPLPVREICLFGEASDGHFHILRRFPLAR